MPKKKTTKAKYTRVRRESQATDVLCVVVGGYKGDKNLKQRVLSGYYRCDEDASWEISNCCRLHEVLCDELFAEFKALKKNSKPGTRWYVSESWSRRAGR